MHNQRSIECGAAPLRATHNDTKISNVLFSEDEKRSVHHRSGYGDAWDDSFDMGDMIRSAATSAAEDERICRWSVQYGILFRPSDGYQSKAHFLTKDEQSLLKESGRAITQIMGIRFLTDYISGDVYYRIDVQTIISTVFETRSPLSGYGLNG